MANPISLPPEIVLGIATIKASGVDPNDFNNAVQELYNRGYGKAGKWIQDNKDLYLQALQNGFVSEGAQVPNSEESNGAPPALDGDRSSDVPMMAEEPVSDTEIAPEPQAPEEVPTGGEVPDDAPAEIPADKPHKRK